MENLCTLWTPKETRSNSGNPWTVFLRKCTKAKPHTKAAAVTTSISRNKLSQIQLDQDGTVSVRTNHRYQFDSKRESGSCSFFNSSHEGSSGYAARSCSF